VPRLLFYVALGVIIVLWLQRVARQRRQTSSAKDLGMPEHLVCGACGRQYDPQKNGWICPQCHK
jgi:predicted amidophosphoribosyltransferase